MNKIHITKDNLEEIIARKCDGRAEADEIQALNDWISQSDKNRDAYQKVLQTNKLYAEMSANPVDVEAAWSNVRSKITKNDASKKSSEKPNAGIYRFLKIAGIAASIVLIAAVGFLLRNSDSNSQYATTELAMSYDLEDGSVINLGKNSALSKLDEKDREYSFSGEAEFRIVHDDVRPFVVHMNDIIVKDLGTVFRIVSIPQNDTVFVSVTEGSAQFYTLTDSGIILESGEEGMYIKSKNRFYKRSMDVKNQFLSITFEDATLGEVVDHLSYSFRKSVSIQNEALRNCNLTVDFSKASLPIVKEIIEETLNVELVENQASISIEGKGCD